MVVESIGNPKFFKEVQKQGLIIFLKNFALASTINQEQ
jgi:hypothetical protein